MLLMKKGFTLIEALISLLILTFLVLFIMNSVLLFPLMVKKDLIYFCVQQAAASGIEHARANPALVNQTLTLECEGMNVEVDITGQVPEGDCGEVVATARYGDYTFEIRDVVCAY